MEYYQKQKRSFHNDKGVIHQKDIIVLNVYVNKHTKRATKCMKQNTRISRQKISKDTLDFNNIVN